MRLSTKFSDTIHLLAFIDIYHDRKLTSKLIAASINTSPVVVRRLISLLKQHHLITTTNKQPTFARPAKDITLLDVYLITEGHTPLFVVDKDTNPHCIVGANIQPVLQAIYHDAETQALQRLNQTTVQDVIDRIIIANKIKQVGVTN